MTGKWSDLNKTWPDWANLIVGAWLFVSVWVLGFADLPFAMWNALVFGAALVVFSIAALMQWQAWEEWIDLGAGAWLVLSPWVLGFAQLSGGGPAHAATLSTLLSGLAVVVFAAWSVWRHRDPGLGAH